MKKPVVVDPEIMAELLAQPDVAKEVAGMSPEALDWYKELLVSSGIYSRYVKEQGQK